MIYSGFLARTSSSRSRAASTAFSDSVLHLDRRRSFGL